MQLADLPGAELVLEGIDDLIAGRETVAALLVAIGGTRLRRLGLPVPAVVPVQAEIRLYQLLGRDHGVDAYGRYNALLRRLVSFERAAEARASRHPTVGRHLL